MIPVECVDGPLKGRLVDMEVEGSSYYGYTVTGAPPVYAQGAPLAMSEVKGPFEYRAAYTKLPDGQEFMIYTSEFPGGLAEEAAPD